MLNSLPPALWFVFGWLALSVIVGLAVARFIAVGTGESNRQVVRDVWDGVPHV